MKFTGHLDYKSMKPHIDITESAKRNAISIMERAVVRKRRIPFVIEAPAKEDVVDKGKTAFDELRRIAAENGLAGLSLEEINEDIRLARDGK